MRKWYCGRYIKTPSTFATPSVVKWIGSSWFWQRNTSQFWEARWRQQALLSYLLWPAVCSLSTFPASALIANFLCNALPTPAQTPPVPLSLRQSAALTPVVAAAGQCSFLVQLTWPVGVIRYSDARATRISWTPTAAVLTNTEHNNRLDTSMFGRMKFS
jgi:hypothetical protein